MKTPISDKALFLFLLGGITLGVLIGIELTS